MIIFSAYLPTIESFSVIKDFLSLVEKNYKDDHVFIGLQKGTNPNVILLLSGYNNLKLHYDFIHDSTYINSDVSGFQRALELYYESDPQLTNTDKYVYFGHTKGVTTGNKSFRDYLYDKHFNNREHIEGLLESDKQIGCYGHLFSPINVDDSYTDVLTKWNKELPYTVLNYFFVNTFYVCKKNILDNFLKNIDQSFFSDNLVDRYFFERDFIHFVDMQGYLPVYDILEGNNGWRHKQPDKNDYLNILSKWKTCNNLL